MDLHKGLGRFLEAQNQTYLKALAEIKNGKKETHWMWYIFPQLIGLGTSDTAKYYGILNVEEARAYLAHPILGSHLIEISEALLQIEGKSAAVIFGAPDDLKLRSSMTLFANAGGSNIVFRQVLEKYYSGEQDQKTISRLEQVY